MKIFEAKQGLEEIRVPGNKRTVRIAPGAAFEVPIRSTVYYQGTEPICCFDDRGLPKVRAHIRARKNEFQPSPKPIVLIAIRLPTNSKILCLIPGGPNVIFVHN